MARARYPTGARPLLIEETARRRRIESRFVATLERAGFAEVVLPIIDFAEPYADVTGRDAVKQSYRFTDRDGELVSVRSDFTPMVARALAPSLADADLPLRVFYRGDVVRCGASRLGSNRELFQIGAEIVGDASVEADLAMLRLAASLIPDSLVVYTNARATIDDPRFILHDDDPEPGYYTGIRFWIYGTDRRRPVAQGGRYDALYARFGASAPAIGFTFTIDDLQSPLPASRGEGQGEGQS
ncbi:MAG TPA: ATP phosphoribosyltransferase regulatory subunit [Thermoanaerobaculia bacterium]|nr:ATP phosphoribosyltransferase regulatory subunit [Thermoanaerobaculia bacterium]